MLDLCVLRFLIHSEAGGRVQASGVPTSQHSFSPPSPPNSLGRRQSSWRGIFHSPSPALPCPALDSFRDGDPFFGCSPTCGFTKPTS